MTIVNHIELVNVDVVDVAGVANELIGNHIPFSHTRNDHVEINKTTIITHIQLPAGYV